MRELLRWLFNISGKELDQATEMLSKDTAKQRLKLVLIQDRLELAPEKLEEMKKEIWEVVSKYMIVDDDFMEFEVRRMDDLTVLVSNIEVKELSDLAPAPTAKLLWVYKIGREGRPDEKERPSCYFLLRPLNSLRT